MSSTRTRSSSSCVWSIGPGNWAAIVVLVDDKPESPDAYRALVPEHLGIGHLTIEVHRCPEHAVSGAAADPQTPTGAA